MKIQFVVSTDNIVDFAEILSDNEMKNEIKGSDEDGCLLIDVYYSRENRDCLEDLEELAETDK